jgi:hypothetical protein
LSPKRGENPQKVGKTGTVSHEFAQKQGKFDQKPQNAVGTLGYAVVLKEEKGGGRQGVV